MQLRQILPAISRELTPNTALARSLSPNSMLRCRAGSITSVTPTPGDCAHTSWARDWFSKGQIFEKKFDAPDGAEGPGATHLRSRAPSQERGQEEGGRNTTTRKPRLTSRKSGLKGSRQTARALSRLMYHEPPRRTRLTFIPETSSRPSSLR